MFSRVAQLALFLFLIAIAANGATIVVPPGGDLQGAINTAALGDTIVLQAGADYVCKGELGCVMPVKSGTGVVAIQSSQLGALPVGVRVGPTQAALLARVSGDLINGSVSTPAFTMQPGAHGYRFLGLEVRVNPAGSPVGSGNGRTVMELGTGGTAQDTLAEVPYDIAIDRCWVHGGPTQETQRGIALNSASTDITNSTINEIHGIGYDTQAICGWNGPGPYNIINNDIEGAGENVMFGGAIASVPNLVPSNIVFSNNHVWKPLSWKVGDPSYAGIHWSIKNLFELKNAQNVTMDGNTFENAWVDAQVGYALLFTVRTENGAMPWATVANITVTNSVVRNVNRGVQTLGQEWSGSTEFTTPATRGHNLAIRNCLFDAVADWFFIVNSFDNVSVEHVTHTQGANGVVFTGIDINALTPKVAGFIYRNNATVRHDYGVLRGDNDGEGTQALTSWTTGAVVEGNVMAAAAASQYPANNSFPADLSTLQSFKGTDGATPGYLGATASIPSPTPAPSPTPTPSPLPSPSPTPSATPAPSPTPIALTSDWPWPSKITDQRTLRETVRQNGWRSCQVWNGRYWCERQ
jgi:hypothetical protein